MVKFVEENERQKRAYAIHRRNAKGRDETTIDKELAAIRQFEESTKFKPFKRFHIEQAVRFKAYLANQKNMRTGKPLGITTIDATLRMVKAFFMLTGIRDGAATSLKLKHVNIETGHVHQDGREVKTKASKTFTTYFYPVDTAYRECFCDWVRLLRTELLFSPGDALFPKARVEVVEGKGFQCVGLARTGYANAAKLNTIIKTAFANVQMPEYTPHSFRKTLVALGDRICSNWEARKAWSMNLGHENVATTVDSYLPVTQHRQMELIQGMADQPT